LAVVDGIERLGPRQLAGGQRVGGERLGVRVRSVLGGLHHEYLLLPALA